jgi:hypothetical protein
MLEDVVVTRPTLSMAVGDGCRCRAPRSSEQPLTHNEAAIIHLTEQPGTQAWYSS